MPDTTAQGTNSISLEAKVIRVDGTEEDLGVIAESTFDVEGIQEAVDVEMAALKAQLEGEEE